MNRIKSHINSLFQPADEHRLTAWLFLKLLALIYFVAFLSLSVEITGLVGANGILPVDILLGNASTQLGQKDWIWLKKDLMLE